MKNKTLLISVAIFIVLAVVFAFTDLAISEAVADPQLGWAHFMELYDQLPGAFVGFLGGSVLLALYKTEKTFKSIAGVIGLGFLALLAGVMFWLDALGAQGGETNPLLALIFGVVMFVLGQVIFRRVPDDRLAEYKPTAKVALTLMFVAGIITVWVFKIPWGRWTYRDILEAGDLSLFTPWYLPQGVNGHQSFFSGHTALSFAVLPVVLLFKNNKRNYTIAWILVFAWGLLGAASRVAIGAHFASDVLFGGGQTLLWFWILRKRFLPDFNG